MAEIVMGVWTSHGPTLSTTPEQWNLRVDADKNNSSLIFRNKVYNFEELIQLRKDENLGEQCALEEQTVRHARCQKAITTLAYKFEEVSPDVCVIIGNDQGELFIDTVIPAFTVYVGDTFYNEPTSAEQGAMMSPGILAAVSGHNPTKYTEYEGLPELGNRVIRDLAEADFDVAQSSKLPTHLGHWSSGIPHAFGFPMHMIMRDREMPILPIITNTFFPPNQPSARRCFDLGKVVGESIRSWDKDLKVAIFGTGGMSHFVIDEEFDRMFFEAMESRDDEKLTAIDDSNLQSGNSELKNWISLAGALFDSDLREDFVDYVPCYRSEAGTGTANGFISWT